MQNIPPVAKIRVRLSASEDPSEIGKNDSRRNTQRTQRIAQKRILIPEMHTCLSGICFRIVYPVMNIKIACDISVTHADPMNEKCGIKMRFPIIFTRAIQAFMTSIFFCSFAAIKINVKSDERK